ncbi:MAG: metal-sensitive transcriptional regulator [Firmicutes bacterium]|nr:metal-sensitive transcriptional regulator [Bacillota bacterium]
MSPSRGSYERNKHRILQRLRRVEGQVRGIHRMVEEDKYCVDVLIQVAAARAALDRVGLALLESHTRGCVARAIKEEHGDEAIGELMEVMMHFIK